MRAALSGWLGAALALVVAATASCGDARRASAPAVAGPEPAPAAAVQAKPVEPDEAVRPRRSGLPEDPVAGKLAYEQWKKHQLREAEERALWFDRERLAQHRALLEQLAAARAQYDRVRRTVDVDRARASVVRRLDQIQARMKQLDPWGNRSGVLPDYAALLELLSGYPDAKGAELEGEAHALDERRVAFDQRVAKITAWLERAEHESEEEGEEHAEGKPADEERAERRERSEQPGRVPADRDQR